MQTVNLARLTRRLALPVLLALAGTACASDLGSPSRAIHPMDFIGQDFNLQIEKTQGPAASSYPNQGAIVRRMLAHGQWSSQGAGGPNHREAAGTSQWRRSGTGEWVEISTETSTIAPGGPASSVLTYTFDGPSHGRWSWNINHGQALLSGSFTTAPSKPSAEQVLAPVTNAGLHVPLIIKSAVSTDLPAGSFPAAGLVLQSYAADGTLSFQGFGPGTINSKGSYTYKRLSANTAVEETLQTSDFFTLPYTMVYTFKTANSGVWYQNFANGLIRFSGTFDTFAR
ncbi:hypothetical protein [Roseateles paludis]|jgi:hypothetical protein|uniref:Lipoprotein n=1 Tax=Roseateles paludis TaxID=3145238 RepID=A0ABV0G4T4_9BURK